MTGNGKFAAFNQVIRNPTISPAARTLYAILWSYADKDGVCWPGIKVLADHLGYKRRATMTLLQELINKGAITKVRRGKTLTNLYSVMCTVAPISDVHSGALHQESDVHGGAPVMCILVHSDVHSGALENALPAYSPNGCGERNIPLNIPGEHTSIRSEQVASAKGKVPPSRCEGVVVNPIGGNAKGISANKKLRRTKGINVPAPASQLLAALAG